MKVGRLSAGGVQREGGGGVPGRLFASLGKID